jgi:crotonobetaine/carnitine-CoA ligase
VSAVGPGWTNTERRTIGAVIDAGAAAHPDRVALVVDDQPLTYAELATRSVSAAAALRSLGVGQGDRVAIFMGTSVEWLLAWFGASRLGALTVPVNTAYRGEFLARQLVDSGASLLVTDAELLGRVTAAGPLGPGLRTLLVRGDRAGAPLPEAPGGLEVHATSVLDEGSAHTGALPVLTGTEEGAVFYTSGTTGPSKGAVVSQHYLLSAAEAMVDCWRLQPGEVTYGPLPLFHLSAVGTVLGPLLAGATGVVDRAFSVHQTWDRVRKVEAAGIILAGPMVMMLWSLPPEPADRDLPIRFLSAAPIPGDLYREIERRYGCKIVTVYGLTEAFPLTVSGVADEGVPGTSGRPNPAFDVRIFDERDHEVPPGTVGQIVCRPLRPDVMFRGYLGQDRATLEQTGNLWFHTGDLGRMDEAGNLTYVDRKKDAIRRRGENVSSYEVELALARHPDVAELAVVGVPSPLGEDDVMACLVLREGAQFDPVAFMDFASERLPYFAVPRYLEVLPELPKNAIGRVLKPALRERGVSPATWDREQAGYVVRR